MKKYIQASAEATNEQLDQVFKKTEATEMTEYAQLLELIQDLQQKVEAQDERISELEWKVEELYSEYKTEHDPYRYD